jgi:hypothetical protein
MTAPYRTVLAGTCLLGGKHTPGSQWAKECPERPGLAAERSARAKRGAQTRQEALRRPVDCSEGSVRPRSQTTRRRRPSDRREH